LYTLIEYVVSCQLSVVGHRQNVSSDVIMRPVRQVAICLLWSLQLISIRLNQSPAGFLADRT